MNKADEIVWSWNEKNGQVTTKLAYEDAMFSSIEDNQLLCFLLLKMKLNGGLPLQKWHCPLN